MDPNNTENPPNSEQSPPPQPSQSEGPKQSDIAAKAAEQRGRLLDPTGRIESLLPDETLIADVRRHPFGLFLIYLQFVVGLTLGLGVIFLLLASTASSIGIDGDSAAAIASAFALFAIFFGLIFLILATRIYKGNQLIVSDKNITQVLQISLFDRKVSELSMSRIEDVTAQQNGILPTIFNYGVLQIETAGEQNNFRFIYCPNPNAYAKAILDARHHFSGAHRDGH